MSRNRFELKWKIFPIISIVFQTVFQMTFCEGDLLWCGYKYNQERALKAVNERNVSVRFKLRDPLTENQSFVWAKWITLDNRLLDNIDTTSTNQGRYKLTKQMGENDIDLFIAFTELSDSGKHVVKIHNGAQPLCTFAVFNLTIVGTGPICSTLLDQGTQRVQMSCEWVQDNLLGDQVQLLAGNQVVHEYETPEKNIDGDFNSTNKISVYLPLENLHDEGVVPSMCLISNNKRSVKTCTFLPIQDQTLHSVFKCCTPEEADAIKFWYNNGSNLIPLILTEKLSLIHVGPLSVFCGVQSGNKTVLLHSIGKVHLVEGLQYNISLSALGRTEGSNNSNENLRCENIFIEVRNTEEDIQCPEENRDLNTMPTDTEGIENTLTPLSKSEGTYKKTVSMETWLVSVLVVSTIAHGVSIIAFVFSYRRA